MFVIFNVGCIGALIVNVALYFLMNAIFGEAFFTNHEIITYLVFLAVNIVIEPFLSPRLFFIPTVLLIFIGFTVTVYSTYGILGILLPVAAIAALLFILYKRGEAATKNKKEEVTLPEGSVDIDSAWQISEQKIKGCYAAFYRSQNIGIFNHSILETFHFIQICISSREVLTYIFLGIMTFIAFQTSASVSAKCLLYSQSTS